MAQVRLEAELAHPPERVWRALTDARLLRDWFLPADRDPRAGGQFTFFEPGQLPGFIGPVSVLVTELERPRRIIMMWDGENLHTRVLWEITPVPGGSRITVCQTGFIGAPATVRCRALRASYDLVFTERLPLVLDRLAAGFDPAIGAWPALPRQRRPVVVASPVPELAPVGAGSGAAASGAPAAGVVPDGGAAIGGAGARVALADGPPDPAGDDGLLEPVAGEEAPPTRRRRWLPWLGAIPAWGRALLLGLAAAAVVVVVLSGLTQSWLSWPGQAPGPQPDRAGPGMASQPGTAGPRTADEADTATRSADGQDPAPSSGRPERAVVPEPAPGSGLEPGGPGGPPGSPAAGASPAAPQLTAEMTTSGRLLGLSGRRIAVTVANPGPGEADPWQVTMDVGDQEVIDVTGADFAREGSLATFTPLAGPLGAGESLQFSFEIPGGVLGLGNATDPTDCRIDGSACG